MKFLRFLSVYVCISLLFSCSEDDNLDGNGWQPNADNQAHSFIYKAMNLWYYWQSDIPQLQDNYFGNNASYNDFLSGFQSPNDLFLQLKYTSDRFSWINSNYQSLINQLQGITLSYGFEYSLVRINNSDELFGYVQYVLPNSPASQANMSRGMVFRKINNEFLTIQNYRNLLSQTNIQIEFADYNSGDITLNGNTTALTAIQIAVNPIYYQNIYTLGNKKIGYLVYNAFTSTYNTQLNEVFLQFKNQNISDLILDFRYNGGGSVETAAILASAVNGSIHGNIFAKVQFNAKQNFRNRDYVFANSFSSSQGNIAINSLQLPKIYVLVSQKTASASELIINGLKPFIDVVIIGKQTYGKNYGSVTLFDSPSTSYLSTTYRNTSHTYAMQPIVFKTFNSLMQSEYDLGFVPDYEINEIDYLNNLPALGNTSEPLLQQAIALITGIPRLSAAPTSTQMNTYFGSSSEHLVSENMYIENVP